MVKRKGIIINWIKAYFGQFDETKKVVIGISGGKDSTICAKLLVEALGKDRVVGVIMPNGIQSDIEDSIRVCELLGIEYKIKNIKKAVDAEFDLIGEDITEEAKINTPARIRMTTLYGLAPKYNALVVNTCNLSEDYIGYATKYGDGAGDFALLGDLTVTEVRELGIELELPEDLVYKTPSDGLCGLSDEDRIGFSYEVLDRFIREGVCENETIRAKIIDMHAKAMHKLLPMPCFKIA